MDIGMKEVKRTNLGGKPAHYHVVYLNDEDGIGATSEENGHMHQLQYDPPRAKVEPTEAVEPQIDPMTGMAAINPETGMPDEGTPANPGDEGKEVGGWIVMPAEDGHTHEGISGIRIKKAKKNEKDSETISDILSMYKASLERTDGSRKKGIESEKFVCGDQWEPNIKRAMESLDRASLTINELGKNVDELLGYQIDQRTDLKYLPQEKGDQRVADVLNVVSKHILDSCYYPREETKFFKDIVVAGFGSLNVYVDFSNDFRGEIKVERFPWKEVHYGEHEKEDLSDCEFEVKSKMYSLAKLKQLFPDKADKIKESFRNYEVLGKVDEKFLSGTNNDYRTAKSLDLPTAIDGDTKLVDIAKKEFRLVQCWQKMYQPVSVVVSETENFIHTAHDWSSDDLDSVKTIPGFQVITQLKPRMRITKFVGNVILSDENPADLPIQDFFTVVAYAYRQDGEYWGKVEVAKDPQREINKRRSQAIDILNRMSAWVWFYDAETFADDKQKNNFLQKSSQPGAMFELTPGANPPRKEEGIRFPTELVQMMQQDQEALSRLMNVTTPKGGANESGSLYQQRQKSTMMGNQFLFDNLSFAKQRLGKLLVHLIQRYYDADRIIRILDTKNSLQQTNLKLDGQDYSQFSKEELVQLLEESDLTAYDVIVSESQFSPSMRVAVATTISELIQSGAQVPPTLPFEFIDAPQEVKETIKASVEQQAQAMAGDQSTKDNSEVIKTLLAKGQYTVSAEKAAELGLVLVTAPIAPNAEGVDNGNIQGDQGQDPLAG